MVQGMSDIRVQMPPVPLPSHQISQLLLVHPRDPSGSPGAEAAAVHHPVCCVMQHAPGPVGPYVPPIKAWEVAIGAMPHQANITPIPRPRSKETCVNPFVFMISLSFKVASYICFVNASTTMKITSPRI